MRISDWSSDVCSSDLCIYAGSRTVGHIATQDHVSELVLQIFLHGPLQWSRAINRIVAYAAEPCSCAIGQVQRDLAVLEQVLNAADLNVHDGPHVLSSQAVEQYDLIQAVEELRPEMGTDNLHYLRFHILHLLPFRHIGEILAAQIAGQDDQLVAEFHCVALSVCQAD